jgi:hypothetical protein
MKNTRNDIEAFAIADGTTLTGASLGNDTNAIEELLTEGGFSNNYQGNDDSKLDREHVGG